MNNKHMMPERMQKLLADQAVQGLTSSEKLELQTMLQSVDAESANRFAEDLELTAATLDRYMSPAADTMDSMPAAMQDNVLAAMHDARLLDRKRTEVDASASASVHELPALPVTPPDNTASRSGAGAMAGWYAAAASFALALIFGWQLLQVQSPEQLLPGAAIQRQALLAQNSTMVIPWQTPDDQRFANVTGDVVWDNASQTGFMRLTNMPVNDPANSQYQLWIVDPERDERPVDGGVFNVSDSGEVIVPINSKLPIIQPAAFAITEEQPGGVVVSAGPLLVVASADQA
jgi:hypothetical protein